MDFNVNNMVFCYSGYTYAQRPIAFYWQENRFEVTDIIAEWHTPDGQRFYVKTEDQSTFELDYNEANQNWIIYSNVS